MFERLLSDAKKFIGDLSASCLGNHQQLSRACWEQVPNWVKKVEREFEKEFEQQASVQSAELVLNNPFSRQGANSVIMYLGFPEDREFKVRIEFLLEHSKVYVSVAKRSPNGIQNLERLADEIERKNR